MKLLPFIPLILPVSLCLGMVNAQDFLWGSATASYQIEGAYNEDGRGMSVWDEFSHTEGKTANGDTGDVADDSYHRFYEDIDLLKKMGANAYRFSISWSRIMPNGEGEINEAGIKYYNSVIAALLDANIVPLVTLFHWDTPLALEKKYGGWLSPDIEIAFAEYAGVCFNAFGDRVKHWLTLNEPMTVALNGYSDGLHAPGRCSDTSRCSAGNSTTEPYIVAHNMLNAHAAAVEIYRTQFQSKQQGVIGITLNSDFGFPLTNSSDDLAAAQRYVEFQAAWFADPVFFGHYPESMVSAVGSRLPTFTDAQRKRIKGSHDFYGLNHYTAKYISARAIPAVSGGWNDDQGSTVSNVGLDGKLIGLQAASSWLNVVPEGMYNILTWISQRYSNPPLLITENGVDVPGESALPLAEALEDDFRVDFYAGYLQNMMKAMAEGVDVRGYFAWSMLDNYEWADGYNYRFGMHYVDYADDLKRYQKKSAKWYSEYIKSHPMAIAAISKHA